MAAPPIQYGWVEPAPQCNRSVNVQKIEDNRGRDMAEHPQELQIDSVDNNLEGTWDDRIGHHFQNALRVPQSIPQCYL